MIRSVSLISCILIETAREVLSLMSSTLQAVKLEHERFVVPFYLFYLVTNANTLLGKIGTNTAKGYCDDLFFSICFEKVKRDRL